jgi:hypothetical protein
MSKESPWDYYPYYAGDYEERAKLPIDKRDTVIDGLMY